MTATLLPPSEVMPFVLEQLRLVVPQLEAAPAASLSLRDDLGLDSLEVVELVMALEQALHQELPDAEIGGWRTLADVYGSVARHAAG